MNCVKIKDNKLSDKHFRFARYIKKLWNMNMTVTPIVIGAYGVMVIVVGNGHGDTSSNPGRG